MRGERKAIKARVPAVRLDSHWSGNESAGESTMNTWSKDELRKIAENDDLHIAPFRADGVTYGTLTWIWSAVVEGDLYVRAYNGQDSRWYQAAMRQKAGRIAAAGMTKDVSFAVAISSVARSEKVFCHGGQYRNVGLSLPNS